MILPMANRDPAFSKVEVRDVYPGVEMVYYGNQQQLDMTLSWLRR